MTARLHDPSSGAPGARPGAWRLTAQGLGAIGTAATAPPGAGHPRLTMPAAQRRLTEAGAHRIFNTIFNTILDTGTAEAGREARLIASAPRLISAPPRPLARL